MIPGQIVSLEMGPELQYSNKYPLVKLQHHHNPCENKYLISQTTDGPIGMWSLQNNRV